MSGGSRGAIGSARLRLAIAAFVLAALVALPTLVAHAAVGDVALVSRATDGVVGNADSGTGLALSASGRFVVFESQATNLSDGAQPGVTNLYLRDRKTGATTLVSRADGADGAAADGDATSPAISPGGRFVAFESSADNLSPDDDNAFQNVFVRDTMAHTTTLVSRAADGSAANGDSSHPAVAANGVFVAFASTADNLSADDNDSFSNIYRRDMVAGTLTVVSRTNFGSLNVPADGDSYDPTIDSIGNRIAYTSTADNLSTKDSDAHTDVFFTDVRENSMTPTAVSLTSGGFLASRQSDGDSYGATISPDGRYVAFLSLANNFVDESIRTPATVDVFRRDVQAGETKLVSRATGADGLPAFAHSSSPSISEGGRYIAFESTAGNLSTEDSADADIFVRSMDVDTTTLVSRATGVIGPAADGSSYAPALSREGAVVAFSSEAANLSGDDDDQVPVRDVFVRRLPVTPAASDPGPDLGSNDHGGHDVGGAAHGGHAAGVAHDAHAAHKPAPGVAPDQSLVGPPVQDVDSLFVLAQVHANAKLVVTASVKLPGRARATVVYRCKRYTKNVPAHKISRVRLKLSRSGLKAVKRVLKRGKRLRAKVVSKAQAPSGGPWGTKRRTIRLIDPR